MNGTVRVHALRKSFGQLEVLRDVSMRFAGGTVTCIIGASGSGKTTLLRCINHLEKPDAGWVSLDDELIGYEVRGEKLVERRERDLERQRRQIGMVFQRFNLFPHMSALANVALAPRVVQGKSRTESAELALHQLEQVGLADKRAAFARNLSGGQQQRVAIARALALQPKVMLFDEPTSALDPELVGEVLDVMRMVAGQGMTMIVVTHELKFANEVASQVVFMDEGTIVETGSAHDIKNNPQNERTRAFISRAFS